jgi:hypothetical protein
VISEKKIFLAVPTGERARNADFYDYYNTLIRPEGTICSFAHGQSPAKNRNEMIALAQKTDCTHIFFLDDDMAPAPDILMKLMIHNVDIVSALYLSRNYPHLPIFFDTAYHNGLCKYSFLTPEKSGLQKGVNCGFGCVLIDLKVFKDLEKPYVRLGEIVKDEWCDDVGFFNRVRAAGFEIYCDFDVLVGHNHNITLFPKRLENGSWVTEYRIGAGAVTFPQVLPTDDIIEQQVNELVNV